MMCPGRGSNSGPLDYETNALPTALTGQHLSSKFCSITQLFFYGNTYSELIREKLCFFLSRKLMEIFLTILTQTIEICSKRRKKFANVCEIHFVKSGIDNEIDETKFFLAT